MTEPQRWPDTATHPRVLLATVLVEVLPGQSLNGTAYLLAKTLKDTFHPLQGGMAIQTVSDDEFMDVALDLHNEMPKGIQKHILDINEEI